MVFINIAKAMSREELAEHLNALLMIMIKYLK